jgi:hypothetical protein
MQNTSRRKPYRARMMQTERWAVRQAPEAVLLPEVLWAEPLPGQLVRLLVLWLAQFWVTPQAMPRIASAMTTMM